MKNVVAGQLGCDRLVSTSETISEIVRGGPIGYNDDEFVAARRQASAFGARPTTTDPRRAAICISK